MRLSTRTQASASVLVSGVRTPSPPPGRERGTLPTSRNFLYTRGTYAPFSEFLHLLVLSGLSSE